MIVPKPCWSERDLRLPFWFAVPGKPVPNGRHIDAIDNRNSHHWHELGFATAPCGERNPTGLTKGTRPLLMFPSNPTLVEL